MEENVYLQLLYIFKKRPSSQFLIVRQFPLKRQSGHIRSAWEWIDLDYVINHYMFENCNFNLEFLIQAQISEPLNVKSL